MSFWSWPCPGFWALQDLSAAASQRGAAGPPTTAVFAKRCRRPPPLLLLVAGDRSDSPSGLYTLCMRMA